VTQRRAKAKQRYLGYSMSIEESRLGLGASRRPPVPPGPYLVLGLGQAGRAAVGALRELDGGGDRVLASDRHPAEVPKRVRRELAEGGARVSIGDQQNLLEMHPWPRTLIKSPGIPMDNEVIREARRRGLEVIDELELGWRLTGAPVVAVTGTNGKTTTSALATEVLASCGLDARLAGNADMAPPLSALKGEPDVIVCEASSFQLEGCPSLLPEVAIFTNLSQDHLSRHKSMKRYGEVKRSMFIKEGVAAEFAVIDTGDDFGRKLAEDVERIGGRVIRVGLGPKADYRVIKARWDLDRSELELATPHGRLTMETSLPGFHNARNVAAVVALTDLLGVERPLLESAVARFPGAPGRFERVECGNGLEMFLDACATPAAAEHFLTAVRSGMDSAARLHVVIGVLGAPDPPQRRAIGRTTRALCDRLLLTAGSFRRRPPLGTLKPMLAGAAEVDDGELAVIVGREQAIASALREADRGDVVAVLGRGNVVEVIHRVEIDDRTVLRRLAASGTRREGERAGVA
jgi:UDP-N-acetylmuramoylalanine--D-glutamate ligase